MRVNSFCPCADATLNAPPLRTSLPLATLSIILLKRGEEDHYNTVTCFAKRSLEAGLQLDRQKSPVCVACTDTSEQEQGLETY